MTAHTRHPGAWVWPCADARLVVASTPRARCPPCARLQRRPVRCCSWRAAERRREQGARLLRRAVILRATATADRGDAGGGGDLDEQAGEEEEEDSVWEEPLEAVWQGWDDPSPENFLVVLLSAVAVAAIALTGLRLGIVMVSIFFTAIKYSFVAVLLVCFAVFFG
jgi:hypothetical protein